MINCKTYTIMSRCELFTVRYESDRRVLNFAQGWARVTGRSMVVFRGDTYIGIVH